MRVAAMLQTEIIVLRLGESPADPSQPCPFVMDPCMIQASLRELRDGSVEPSGHQVDVFNVTGLNTRAARAWLPDLFFLGTFFLLQRRFCFRGI